MGDGSLGVIVDHWSSWVIVGHGSSWVMGRKQRPLNNNTHAFLIKNTTQLTISAENNAEYGQQDKACLHTEFVLSTRVNN